MNTFEYKGVRGGNTWTFGYCDHFEMNGEWIDLRRELKVSLSQEGAERLSEAYRGGGRNRQEMEIANAVSKILNSATCGRVGSLKVSDAEVERYLCTVVKA